MQAGTKPAKLPAVAEEETILPKPDACNESPTVVTPDNCLNCSALLSGPYCSSCGQKKRALRIGFREFLHDLIHEFAHLDGKFARTMGLLLRKPGQPTIEFLAGRRASYVSPVRLYLIWSAVFFTLALSFPGAVVLREGKGSKERPSVQSGQKAPTSRTAPAVAQAPASEKPGKSRDPKALSEMFLHNVAKGMFLLMPFFGLLLFVFYRRQEPFYLPHLYFSVHYHSFVFLVMSVMVLLKAPELFALDKIGSLVELTVPVYLYLALRRVYQGSRLGTVGKMIGVGLIYVIGLGATFVAILMFIILRN